MGQPLSSVSGRKRYNTLDFASKIVCQQGCCSPLLETRSQRDGVPLDTPPVRAVAIHPVPTDGCAPARTDKTGTEICPNSGQISVPVFIQRWLGKAYAEALQNPQPWLEIFVLECEN